MKKIEAKIVADSKDLRGNRITSFLLTYPRFIHGELMTHRMFSRNSASSRAIPFEKMIRMVEEDPFIPIAWQKGHKGMQGSNYITSPAGIKHAETLWLKSFYQASRTAKNLYNLSGTSYRGGNTYPGPIEDTFSDFGEDEDITITKQVVNRLLEPFMWHTVLVTATEFDNFFKLRCPIYKGKFQNWRSWKDVINHAKKENPGLVEDLESYSTIKRLENSISGAEIHMQVLAENMWDAYQESIPKLLQPGEYHIPFGDKIYSENGIEEVLCNHTKEGWVSAEGHDLELDKIAIQIATARCARLSYMTFDNKIDYEKDIKLHDRLLLDKHASPFEHVSRCLTEEEYNTLGKMILDPGKGYIFEKGWVDNFKGFVSYRRILNF